MRGFGSGKRIAEAESQFMCRVFALVAVADAFVRAAASAAGTFAAYGAGVSIDTIPPRL